MILNESIVVWIIKFHERESISTWFPSFDISGLLKYYGILIPHKNITYLLLSHWVPFITYCAEGASFSATRYFQELVSVCAYFRNFCDFCGGHMRRLHPVFPLLAFHLGISGIQEIHEKTAKSYQWDWSSRTPFLDSFVSLFSEKFTFCSARPGEGPATRFSSYQDRLRRNPARRVNLN